MQCLRVGAAALNQTPLDWQGNLTRITEAIAEARRQHVALLCLPELAITGYGCEDAFGAPDVAARALQAIVELAPSTAGMVVAVGLPVYCQKALYNGVAVLADGRLLGLAAKQNLAGDGIHYEPRWFRPWPAGQRDTIDVGNVQVPLGDLLFDIGGVSIGFEICEDAWVAARPGAGLAMRGADLILNPSASHFAFGKFAVRQQFVCEGSRAFGVAYVYANLMGNEAGRVIYDGGCMIAAAGALQAVGPRLTFRPVELTSAIIDIDAIRRDEARRPSSRSRHDLEAGTISLPFAWPKVEPSAPAAPSAAATATATAWEHGAHLKHEEFTRAVSLGLWDYLRKSRAHGYVISLSGGADSATCAAMVQSALALAHADLGAAAGDAVAHAPALCEALARGDLVGATRAALTCAYQATVNSSETTRAAAATIARAVGAHYMELNVEPLVSGYRTMIEAALGRALTWDGDDIALQNIQARVRAPSAWMLANLAGAILLTTSNRSEAAVGYATMDGDMAGGLAPLGGIDKSYLRAYLRWREHEAPLGLASLPALAHINRQAPTAELRPAASTQTDEADLMPYDVLEAIEDLTIRDKYAPREVLTLLAPQFPAHREPELVGWITRFFTLWARNQWKRERMAPSFHLDDRNVDPRSWCRFPILSGGFASELALLPTTSPKRPNERSTPA